MKSGAQLVTLILLLLIMSTFIVSAVGDVAYIYNKKFKIDKNIVDLFNKSGLQVDLIRESAIPRDLSGYKFLFVGDENFRTNGKIPVNKFPSVVINYYHGDVWGFSDNEGVSELAANHPLSVVQNNRMIQVYTSHREHRRNVALPYYFIDKTNKLASLNTIATTEVTSSGKKFGDVIAYINESTRLLNGKTQEGRLCFYGIVKSDFWTPAARKMFEECAAFVAGACQKDDDCPLPIDSPLFCKDGDVYKTQTTNTCINPGKLNAQCDASTQEVFVEDCQFGCENGACLAGNHDVALITFAHAVNNIKIEEEDGTEISGNELRCNNKYKVSITVENQGDFIEDVTFQGSLGSLTINHLPVNNFAPQDKKLRTRTLDLDLSEGNYLLSVEAILTDQNDATPENNRATREISVICRPIVCSANTDCNDNNPGTFDECINPGTDTSECRNTPINCASDADCGFTGFLGQEFCAARNIAKNFQEARCNNPGTLQSSCSVTIETRVLTMCQAACANAACIPCNTNVDCNDDDSSTTDQCHNPGTPQSFCTNDPTQLPTACSANTDCGIDSVIGQPFCAEKDVKEIVRTFTCHNPGTPESSCSSTTIQRIKTVCQDQCLNGQCITVRCNSHDECNDNNPGTIDICNNPGTSQSFCTNNPADIICTSNTECGSDGFISDNICLGKDITRLFQSFVCQNPNTPQSFCSSTLEQRTTQSCTLACQNGQCLNPRCLVDNDCNDNNPKTIDECVNPATNAAECRNTPINCASDADCGTDTFVGQEFCIGSVVYKNFQDAICRDPGTIISSCLVDVSSRLVHTCINACANGVCIRCNSDTDCNDNNPQTIDTCFAAGTVISHCQSIQACTSLCSIGTKQCFGSGVQVCGDFNGDGCSEWSLPAECGFGKACSAGECFAHPITCNNLCTLGTHQCTGNALQFCGDYNGDGCSEWSLPAECGFGKACSQGKCILQ